MHFIQVMWDWLGEILLVNIGSFFAGFIVRHLISHFFPPKPKLP